MSSKLEFLHTAVERKDGIVLDTQRQNITLRSLTALKVYERNLQGLMP